MAEPALSVLRGRGPDDQRLEWGPGWILGHTRLAIIDLSRRSSQPMTDGQGLWLVYNGEIYNFRELRAELELKGCRFASDGDAEVLLQALRHWGLACLERLRGMFAFALVDLERRELILARDRYGVKPLAYEIRDAGIRFASDLRALRSLPNASREIDSESAYLYMALGYIPAPHTIHQNVRKVKPGHYVRVRWSDGGVDDVRELPYWSIRALHDNGDGAGSVNGDLTSEFERRVFDAVRCRLISDVPVGTLLSGGIDSTLVTSFSRELSGFPLPAFTMGFDDPGFDEAPFARAIAKELGGSHHEFRITDSDIDDVWNRMWTAYDEPFADSSAIPTVMLSRGVASSVKVALTGDGGDEVGCGYEWHQALNRLDPLGTVWREGLTDSREERMARFRKWHRIPERRTIDRAGLWSALRTGLSDEMLGVLPLADPLAHKPLSEYFREWSRDLAQVEDCFTWAGQMDLLTYVPDDLMVKADRASMSAGLEMREPLLDHQLTAWLLQTPVAARYDRELSITKVLPRRALVSRISSNLLDRQKQGFTPPLAKWLAGPLAEPMAEALERLGDGRLEPIVMPHGCTSWRDCDPALRDENNDFLWRIICFSEWSRHAGDS
ncbi:MAG: asparagine synthase (glutamine-hydrolyzing) [Gemmatimonadota bacterium]|nr:asparagine synthase (glutamine-hydrolyzing) [Gemmatimonadota bacterium]